MIDWKKLWHGPSRAEEAAMFDLMTGPERVLWVMGGISFRKPRNHPDWVEIQKAYGEYKEPYPAANLYVKT